MYSAGKPFTSPQTGGNKRFEELTRYLCNNGNTSICCGDDPSSLGVLKKYVKYSFKSSQNRKSIIPPEAKRLWANRRIVHTIKNDSYDAIVTFDVPPTIGLCLYGVKNIVLMIRKDLLGYEKTIHPQISLMNIFRRAYLWICEDICIRKVKTLIVQCEYDKQEMLNRHPLIKKRITEKFLVQINNVNPSWIVEKSREREIDSCDDKFHVVFIGNFSDNRKGHSYLLPAALNLVNRYDDIVFDIIGDGKEYEKYKKEYRHERIIFHGRVNNPIPILKASCLSIVPSLADSCPNTIMESLYNCIPVIASNRGGIPEILRGCEEALFDLSEEEIIKAISKLHTHSDLLLQLSERQKERKIELTFDWPEKIAMQLKDK